MGHDRNETKRAVRSLSKFIQKLIKEVKPGDKEARKVWRKNNEQLMEKCFWYKRKNGMPSITSLVTPFYHPTQKLIGLNYSPVAHLTLHQFSAGWTLPLRLCRGIIFDYQGNLVAMPFIKFFNYNEHPETRNLPEEPFDATVKHDGHLGIIFQHNRKLYITTRGSFVSPSSLLGTSMLKNHSDKNNWPGKFPKDLTVLVEIIHPNTKVHLNYRRKKEFILIGANNINKLEDLVHGELLDLGKLLNLPVTEKWNGNSLKDLEKLMLNMAVKNREGYVVRFQSGLRVKFKFTTYINLMVEAKLNYSYLMNRIMSGNLKKMIGNLEEEVYTKAEAMVADLMKVKSLPGSEKEKWCYLYNLMPKKKQTSSYKAKCRAFSKFLAKN